MVKPRLPLAAALLAACAQDPAPVAPTPPAPPPLPALRLVVDGDRNGRLDDSRAEYAARATWSATQGAMLLANVDDDDGNHAVDALDDAVNGEADAADLARVRVPAWPAAPEGVTATLRTDAPSAERVRLFRRRGDAWERWDTARELTRDELRAGVEFGIEAKDFPSPEWNGRVELTLAASAGGVDGGALTDTARMRTAPWVMYDSTAPTVRVFGPEARGFWAATAFTNDLRDYTDEDGMDLTLVNTLDRTYAPNPMEGPDVWMQDIMEFGWTAIPGPDGLHGMPVVLRTPNPQRPVARYTERELLGPDLGYVWKRATVAVNGRRWDVSLDSFGNLELLPPYRNGMRDFPLGRVIHGSVTSRSSDVALRQFLESQGVQGPPLYVDTSWLHVGHIDEVISFIPKEGAPGWKLLVASPRLAREMLTAFAARSPANGALTMFTNKNWYYESGPMQGRPYPAQRTVRAILADETLMGFNQQAQARIDALREQLQEETGLADADIVEIPFLMWPHEMNRASAYMPGTVNLLLYNRVAIMPRPYGPLVGDRDIVEDDLVERLRPHGITVRFAEQWDLLHAAQGEVHCGTNAIREIPQRRWWEVAR